VTAIICTKINVQEIEGEQAEKIIRKALACLIQMTITKLIAW